MDNWLKVVIAIIILTPIDEIIVSFVLIKVVRKIRAIRKRKKGKGS